MVFTSINATLLCGFAVLIALCALLAAKVSREEKKHSFAQLRLEREQKKQKLKSLFCEESQLPNINYIQKRVLQINEVNESSHHIMHVVCVGRSSDYYRFFDSKTSRKIKTQLHNHLNEMLSPSVIGLFEDRYIVLVFVKNSPWLPEQIIEQQQKVQRALPYEQVVDDKLLPFDYSIASMSFPDTDIAKGKNYLFKKMAYCVKKSLKSIDGLYIYSNTDYQRSLRKRQILQDLSQDICQGGDQFELCYQPIFNSLNTAKVCIWEILLRWKRTEYGGPGEFMPLVATKPHLHYSLTMMILNKVIDYATSNKESIPNISINVSNSDLMMVDFFDDVMIATERYRDLRKKIIFEVVEYSEILSKKHVKENIINLKNAGFRFAIDDFGCGYSNLNLLSEKHFDFIKIDKSVIGMCDRDTVASETLKFMIKLSESINATLVVEGVETVEHLHLVPKQSNVLIQGFLLSKPVSLTSSLRVCDSVK
ncbi:EAL domain-containing protein [Photobacterium swingsii]|uniref:EAL domain-containing protein n=1 Tax=Photobacterium swingsii TaxID=680026 RepID=UPI00406847A5